jgi:hypothetical protein
MKHPGESLLQQDPVHFATLQGPDQVRSGPAQPHAFLLLPLDDVCIRQLNQLLASRSGKEGVTTQHS